MSHIFTLAAALIAGTPGNNFPLFFLNTKNAPGNLLFMFHKTMEQDFKIKAKMSCLSKNLLYCIICRDCHRECIRQTGDCLRNRLTVHRQQINHPELRHIDLRGHLADCAKHSTTKFDIIPFYKIREDRESLRKTMENYFINKFRPELNKLR